MKIERRTVKGAIVRGKAGAADKPAIEGYGAVFGQDYVLYEDSGYRIVERIAAGAFTRVLEEKQDTRCLFNHEPDNVLGRTTNNTLRMDQDDEGLHYENDLDVRSTVGQNVQAFVDRGDVTGCSFAFTVRSQTWKDEKSDDGITICTREITEIDTLYDVGPVTYPAYDGTSVSARAEMRSAVLAIEALPAALRSRLSVHKRDDGKCNCRCVACAKDNDCEACADHMIDCGDEQNCACMSSRSRSSAPAELTEDEQIAADVAACDARLRRAGLTSLTLVK